MHTDDMNRQAEPRRCRLACVGPLTIYEAPARKREFLEALDTADILEIDLSAVEEMDSAGLQLLLLAVREANRSRRTLTLAGASPAATEVLDRYGLRDIVAAPRQAPPADEEQEVDKS